ncbi:MAG TPA: hypothetical protein VGR14_14505 [Verrucomicrobiae bacterium]|nr:hypothetical protein [Verrucomicrobiae bacterium]
MTANNGTAGPMPSGKLRARRLRIIAAIVLLLGIFGADGVYWLGTRSAEDSVDPSMMGNEKAQVRKEQMLYGNQSILIDRWTEDLKRPGTQAAIVVLTAVLVAGGCFYFAHLLHHADD